MHPNPIQLNNQVPEHPWSPLSAGPSALPGPLPGDHSRCPAPTQGPSARNSELLPLLLADTTTFHSTEEISHHDVPSRSATRLLCLFSSFPSKPKGACGSSIGLWRSTCSLSRGLEEGPFSCHHQSLPSPGILFHWFYLSQVRLHLDT